MNINRGIVQHHDRTKLQTTDSQAEIYIFLQNFLASLQEADPYHHSSPSIA